MAFICAYEIVFPDNFPEDLVVTRDEYYDEWYAEAFERMTKARAAIKVKFTNETYTEFLTAYKYYYGLLKEMRLTM